jgi:hypothetical protein
MHFCKVHRNYKPCHVCPPNHLPTRTI